jgi:methylmalonyl-CoA mutase C-terminal domain/subunit
VNVLREKGLDEVMVFAGGIIPDEDVAPLKKAGVAAIFGPGTNTDAVVEFIRGSFQTA